MWRTYNLNKWSYLQIWILKIYRMLIFSRYFKFMYIFFEQVQVDCNWKHLPKILQFWQEGETKFELWTLIYLSVALGLKKPTQHKYLTTDKVMNRLYNKTAAQAASADPSQCSSTSRQNLPIQQNRRNFWNQYSHFDAPQDLESLKYS